MLWRKLLRYQRVRVRQWIPQNLWYLLGRRNHHQHHCSVPCFADTWRWSFSWVPGAEVASSDGDQHRLAPSAWLHPRIELVRVRPDQDINSGYYLLPNSVRESIQAVRLRIPHLIFLINSYCHNRFFRQSMLSVQQHDSNEGHIREDRTGW